MPHVPVRHPFGTAARSKSAVLPICRTRWVRTYTLFQKQKAPLWGPVVFGGEGVCSVSVTVRDNLRHNPNNSNKLRNSLTTTRDCLCHPRTDGMLGSITSQVATPSSKPCRSEHESYLRMRCAVLKDLVYTPSAVSLGFIYRFDMKTLEVGFFELRSVIVAGTWALVAIPT